MTPQSPTRRCARCAAFLALAAVPAAAQQGDREGHVMTPPPEHWIIPEAPVLSPEELHATFALEEGFEIELVAAEPMVHDPVAVAWDGNGRLWVAEMLGYMPDIDGELESEVRGRISVLEDTDGDGRADRHTVFLEDYLLPRAIALADADRKLLFADNLRLYEAEILVDEDGAIRSGGVEVVDESYAAGGNPEHKANGLLRALDNWFYNAKSDRRYRPGPEGWIVELTEDRGQWGIAQDDYGRLITNTNSNLITVEEVPPGLTVRNPAHSFRARTTTRMADQSVWPSRVTPGVNRGYMDGVLTEDGYLTTPTAASGMAYYRGDQFPERYRGDIFITEPSGNLVKRASVTAGEDGYRTVASATEGFDFLTSTDERSRMVQAYTAPDGSLYLLDFYRGIIQHKVYMTSYLRAQVEERGLYEPIGLGRIWRVRHREGAPLNDPPRMQEESSLELVAHLSHPNGWWRDTAQRLIVERGGDEAADALRALAADGRAGELARVHALWTLEGLGILDAAALAPSFAEPAPPRLVAEAIRAAETLAPGDGEALALLRAAADSPHAGDVFVRRQLAASLGLFGEEAHGALRAVADAAGGDALVRDLAVSGLGGGELAFLKALPDSHALRAPLIEALARRDVAGELEELAGLLRGPAEYRALARAAVAARRRGQADRMLELLGDGEVPAELRTAVAEGMVQGGEARNFRPIPVTSASGLERAGDLEDGPGPDRLAAVAKLFDVGTGEEVNYLVTEEHRRQFEEGEHHYARLCLACHQAHGRGMEFLAPPLTGSEWVLESTNRLIAVVMDGVMGPIEVAGKLYTPPEIQPVMPGLRFSPDADDEQLAAILTYVRNAWGNAAPPVSAEEVAAYRENYEARAPWPAEELMQME